MQTLKQATACHCNHKQLELHITEESDTVVKCRGSWALTYSSGVHKPSDWPFTPSTMAIRRNDSHRIFRTTALFSAIEVAPNRESRVSRLTVEKIDDYYEKLQVMGRISRLPCCGLESKLFSIQQGFMYGNHLTCRSSNCRELLRAWFAKDVGLNYS